MNCAASSSLSYLPNPTRDPARDMAHPGYRLATFSALPPAVPVSRIRLADAGFYYQGHGDEVVCFSCGARHAGWRQGDNPLGVHRRLSPQCLHVASRDREVATVASFGAFGITGAGGDGRGGGGGGGGDFTGREMSGSDRTPQVARSARQTTTTGVVNNSSTLRTAEVSRSTPPVATPARIPGASNVSEDGETPATIPQQPSATVPSKSPGPREPPPASFQAPSRSSAPPTNARFVSPDGGSSRTPSATTTNSSLPAAAAPSAANTVTSEGSRDEPSPRNFASQSVVGTSRSGGGSSGDGEGPSSLFPRAGLDLGGAVYPMYQDMQSRRRTFQTWDAARAPPLDLIILCGMFYAGYADCVRCFYCGVGLKHWLPTDDVWTEHVRWRPSCQYLRAVKGDDFIRDTQQRLAQQGSSTNAATETSSSSSSSSTRPPQGLAQPPASDAPRPSQAPLASTPALTSLSDVTAPAAAPSVAAVATASAAARTAATSTAGSAPTASPRDSTTTTTTSATEGSPAAAVSGDVADRPSSDQQPSSSSVFPADRPPASSRVVGNEADDRETVNRLQAENEALSQRLRCRVCRTAAVDTILMPCGHLVCCEACARSARTCPLCHDTIRATARVHMN